MSALVQWRHEAEDSHPWNRGPLVWCSPACWKAHKTYATGATLDEAIRNWNNHQIALIRAQEDHEEG